ncbi:MAG: hypothetical protein ABSG52_00865 [Terriglobales bacterium]|jgi:hypothetical protein
MRPTSKDPYGRPGQQPGQGQNRPGYGQQPGQRPGYGQPPAEEKKQQPSPVRQPGNVKADVIWALRNAGGGMSVFDISSKITAAGKPRYAETKIMHILEMLVVDHKVNKGDETGRVTYKWAVEAI